MGTLVAQGIEHRIPNPGVARSNRAEGTSRYQALAVFAVSAFLFVCYFV